MTKSTFDKYFEGAINDIYLVDECYSCVFMISDNAKAINRANIGHFFGRVQQHFYEFMVLVVARIFDDRTDVYSIPTMVSNASSFQISSRINLKRNLEIIGADSNLISIIKDEGFSSAAVRSLRNIVPTRKSCPAINRLMNMRHKEIAHRDNSAETFERPFFKDVIYCNQLAKNWIAFFSDAVRGGHFRDENGMIPIFDDALKTSRQLRKIFQITYSIPGDKNFPDAAITKLLNRNRANLAKTAKSRTSDVEGV